MVMDTTKTQLKQMIQLQEDVAAICCHKLDTKS